MAKPRKRKSKPVKIEQPQSKKKQKSQSREIRQFEVIGKAKGLSGDKLAEFVRVQLQKASRVKKKEATKREQKKPKRSKRHRR